MNDVLYPKPVVTRVFSWTTKELSLIVVLSYQAGIMDQESQSDRETSREPAWDDWMVNLKDGISFGKNMLSYHWYLVSNLFFRPINFWKF